MVWGDVNIYSKRLFVWRTPRIYSLLPRRKPLLSCQSKWKMRWSIIDHCITNLQFSTFTQLYMQCEIWNVILGLLLASWGKSNSLTASRCNWFRDSVRIIDATLILRSLMQSPMGYETRRGTSLIVPKIEVDSMELTNWSCHAADIGERRNSIKAALLGISRLGTTKKATLLR